MTIITRTESWITCGSEGNYAIACVRAGYSKPHQFLVVGYFAWLDWYNEARWSNKVVKPPLPVFVGDNYEAVIKVADELNGTTK